MKVTGKTTTMTSTMLLLGLLSSSSHAFSTPKPQSTTTLHLLMASRSDMSAQIKDMRAQLAENEEANMMMQALRGQNLNDDDTAMAGLEMRLVDVGGDEGDVLPLYYDPVALKAFFRKRPLAVATRILQLASVGGGVIVNTFLDNLLGRLEKDPELEVQRAAELRDIITSLGPFFIKLGQALSIRPDILSPRSMVELQKLCDKVPSYDSNIAFATIEVELGQPVS